ncbi:hypothetical protein T492DRAFT_831989 [Pavlovales sp. CCMP2436]|nr:hypothetical protein T492DRAFT_831989 [Pavlovales sp. CCMP2436]
MSTGPVPAVDLSRLVMMDGLQQLLGELLEAAQRQKGESAQLRTDMERMVSSVERRLDGLDASIAARASEREVRRVESEARAAREGIARTFETLASKFNAAVETIDARDSRRLLLLTEVHNEVKSCASAKQMALVEQQLVAAVSLEQLQATRQGLEQQLRASSDAWVERATALERASDGNDAAVSLHTQQIAKLAATDSIERAEREIRAELGALASEFDSRLSEVRHAAVVSERGLARRSDDLKGELELALQVVRRTDTELKSKVGRDGVAAQLDELSRALAAERQAAEADARNSREDVAERLNWLATALELAGDRAVALDALLPELARSKELLLLEQRLLSLATKDELRVELEASRAESLARARRIGERVELLGKEVIRVGSAADAASAASSRQLQASWGALALDAPAGPTPAARVHPERTAAVGGSGASSGRYGEGAQWEVGGSGASSPLPPDRVGVGPRVRQREGGGSGDVLATPQQNQELATPGGLAGRRPMDASPSLAEKPYGSVQPPYGGVQTPFLAAQSYGSALQPYSSAQQPYFSPAISASSALRNGSAPDAARYREGEYFASTTPGATAGSGGGVPLGGALSAVGLRTDLERRRRQLEERRQSIAAVRQRAASGTAAYPVPPS